VKGKVVRVFSEHDAKKAYSGSGGIAPLILDGTRWGWVVSFTPRPIYPRGKSPWYPLVRWLGGPHNQYGRCGEEKNSLPLPGIWPWSSSP